MSSSYDVRIWRLTNHQGKQATTYKVRWIVAGQPWKESFKTEALADSFRSELLVAQRRGDAFDTTTGRSVSANSQDGENTSWIDFACSYVDMKWPSMAAKSRRGIAETLITTTPPLLTTSGTQPDPKTIRLALRQLFNTTGRDADSPDDVTTALRWLERHTQPVAAFTSPATVRAVLDAVGTTLDGKPAAPSVIARKRAVLSNALDYAVERNLLPDNPLTSTKWRRPRTSPAIDRRCVVNPVQARTLLNAVGTIPRLGPQLVAFFGVMYYSALRPEEAINLRKHNLSLPEEGWGEILLEHTAPEAGKDWTDTGTNRDRRGLKHRARDEIRPVPSPPELTALLHAHLTTHGTDSEGRLFRAERGGELNSSTYTRVWHKARAYTFTPNVAASP